MHVGFAQLIVGPITYSAANKIILPGTSIALLAKYQKYDGVARCRLSFGASNSKSNGAIKNNTLNICRARQIIGVNKNS